MSRSPRRPTLQFGPSSSFHGFTSYETSAFNDVEPARVVRELIQNSLDAAVDAGELTAIVRFRVSSMRRSDVPDLPGYEKSFKSAVKLQKSVNADGRLPDTAKQVVNQIEYGLRKLKRGRHHELVVMDNGIGLDDRSMHSILGNGASSKIDGTGSYGVGHLAAMATSDLRYALYAAVNPDGERIAAGNAVLASMPGRSGEASSRDSNGYLVKKLLSGANGRFYEFLTGEAIPSGLRTTINEIESEWGHGTAVVIPAFNHFRESPKRLWEIVSTVVARNFNVAVFEGKLVVEVDNRAATKTRDERVIHRLDTNSLLEVLELKKDEQRAPRTGSLFGGLGISGQIAYMTHQALSEGETLSADIKLGVVNVQLLTPSPNGRVRLDLYRNGMRVTNQIPDLAQSDFADREPFYAVLKVTRDSGDLYRLIRKAEGPMHDKLDLKRLENDEQRQLRESLKEIANRIKEAVPERSQEGYAPDDYLVLEDRDNANGDGGSFSFWGSPEIIRRRTPATVVIEEGGGGGPVEPGPGPGPGPGPSPGPNPGPVPRTYTRTAPPLDFLSTAVSDGNGKCAISLTSGQSLDDAVLSLQVDENSDATCDRISLDEAVRLTSVEVRGGEDRLLETPSVYNNGAGIRIQGLNAGVNYELDVGYSTPEGLDEVVAAPVFRVELRRFRAMNKRS